MSKKRKLSLSEPTAKRQREAPKDLLSEIKQHTQVMLENNQIIAQNKHLVETLREKVLYAYQEKVLSQLNKALESENILSELEQVLSTNWQLIKGTLLSYTAQPENELTLLLSDVAKYIESKAGKAALTVLMPLVKTISEADDYPDLEGKDAPAIHEILKTHILSESEHYLIPVRALLELILVGAQPKIFHKYYDAFDSNTKQDNSEVSEAELGRLYQHSPETQSLFESKKHYDLLLNDNRGLLGHLQSLIRALRLNGVQGTGSEENAGGMAYGAILEFRDYFDQLGEDQKKKIPEALLAEIELLLSLSFNKDKNTNATENVETCVNTRQEELSKQIQVHEKVLYEIKIDGDAKEALLEKASNQFEECKKALELKLEEETYDGSDKLGITRELLTTLDVALQVTSLADLHDLMTSSAEEINDILKENTPLQQQIVQQINSVETLVIFFHETSLERLQAVLPLISNELFVLIIEDKEDFSACLTTLNGERLKIVCSALKEQLTAIIKDSVDFVKVLRYLTPEQCAAVCVAMKDKLPTFIKNRSDFTGVLDCLTPEQRTAVYETMKDQLPVIIKGAFDFYRILKYLTPEQCTAVYEAMKNQLSTIIKSASDFASVLEYLTPEQRTAVFEAMKRHLTKIIKSVDDFKVLKLLTPEQCAAVCNALKNRLAAIIKSASDFDSVLKPLTSDQRTAVCVTIKDLLPAIIQSSYDFYSVLQFLTPEQRTVVYEAMKDKLPAIIQSGSDFYRVLVYLTPEQRAAVYEAMKDKLTAIIKSVSDLADVLKYFTPEQCAAVCVTMKDKLPAIIKSGSAFANVLHPLTHEQCAAVCKAMKDQLPTIIQSGFYFAEVLRDLTPKQRTAVYKVMKDKLLTIIKSSCDFANVLQYLTPEQRAAVYEAMKDQLPTIIEDSDDFAIVLKYLTPEQCTAVCETMKDQLHTFIKSVSDFAYVLQYLTPEQRTAVYEAMKDQLPTFIKNRNDFTYVLKYLTPEQQTEVCEVMTDQLPAFIQDISAFIAVRSSEGLAEGWEHGEFNFLSAMIKNSDDLVGLLTHLDYPKSKLICNIIKNNISEIITDAVKLTQFLERLNAGQQRAVCEVLGDNKRKRKNAGFYVNYGAQSNLQEANEPENDAAAPKRRRLG